jgi:methionine-S-sulfoxide reductase
MGCFWGAEVLFGGTEGVVRTSVGFAGGAYENPTYQDIGDHIETVVVEYEPDRVSYADLLELFWNGHDPGHNPWMNQYRSMLFPVTDEQRRAAERSVERHRNQQVGAVLTEVRPIERFYPDRTYHQKYYLRNNARLWNLVVGAYGSERAAERSTVAARANALLARGTTHGTVTAAIDAAVAAGGISPEDAADLKDALSARRE